jgi:hypothetical protein
MTSDAGLTSQDTDYARDIQEVLNELRQMERTPRLVTSPDELEALEREMRRRTDRASIMASATPFCFWAMQKPLTVERKRRSRT